MGSKDSHDFLLRVLIKVLVEPKKLLNDIVEYTKILYRYKVLWSF